MASICSGCVKVGDAAPTNVLLTGVETTVAGAECYVVGSGSKALILCSDIFGWKLTRFRQVAEQYAGAGFTVYIPNYLTDPADASSDDLVATFMANFMTWLAKNPIAGMVEIVKSVAKFAASKHESVQAVGFCLGAKSVVEALKANLVKSGAVFHPSFLTPEDAALLAAKPMLFNCAETDGIFTPELRATFEKELKGDGKSATFLDYPGTSHGFGGRPTGEQEQTMSLKAHAATFEFFKANA